MYEGRSIYNETVPISFLFVEQCKEFSYIIKEQLLLYQTGNIGVKNIICCMNDMEFYNHGAIPSRIFRHYISLKIK